jgi:hypothetical protein
MNSGRGQELAMMPVGMMSEMLAMMAKVTCTPDPMKWVHHLEKRVLEIQASGKEGQK